MAVVRNDFQIVGALEDERLKMSNRLTEIAKENIEVKSIHDLAKHAKEVYITLKLYLRA